MRRESTSPIRTAQPGIRAVAGLLAFVMTAWSASPLLALGAYTGQVVHGHEAVSSGEGPGVEMAVMTPEARPVHHSLLDIAPLNLELAEEMAQERACHQPEESAPNITEIEPIAKRTGCCCELGAMLCTACDMNAAAGTRGAPAFKATCGIPGSSEEGPIPSAMTKFFFGASGAEAALAELDLEGNTPADMPEDIHLSPTHPPPQS